MENCLFVANLPQSLSNYELTIALYLLFSKFGKVVIVKASRDTANRPFGFVEYTDSIGAQNAIKENSRNEGITLGGRKIRIEVAKSTAKLTIRTSLDEKDFIESVKKLQKAFQFSIWIGKADECCQSVSLKFENSRHASTMIELLRQQKPNWSITDSSKQETLSDYPKMIAESLQRQSGLFQLRIPESGVLPVSHSALAKINALISDIKYSVTAQVPTPTLSIQSFPSFPHQSSPLGFSTRRYEDLRIEEDGTTKESLLTDPIAAKESILSLNPLLGDSDTDVFFGRLDNQEVTVNILLQRVLPYGPVSFIRLCNRLVSRIDNIPVDSTAYVRFKTSEAAAKCMASENGVTWMGRIIKCEKCWSSSARQTPPLNIN